MEDPAGPTACRGVRGAITVDRDDRQAVDAATAELLDAVVSANGLRLEDVAAAIFTMPDELSGSNPAAAARRNGWELVPMLVVREHGGDASVERCVRVLILWNTTRTQQQIHHVYLRGARALRPDLAGFP
ncbi:MAG TPA: chorismate mutase [Actinomycetota bacterium]